MDISKLKLYRWFLFHTVQKYGNYILCHFLFFTLKPDRSSVIIRVTAIACEHI